MKPILKAWTDWFVVWVLGFSALAYAVPSLFTWFRPCIVPGLGVIMFGMGMTLVPDDFRRVVRMPRAVACGVLGQFLIMPLAGLFLANVFRLPPELAMGFIILGSCPGGTASNVIAYLAKADVALSVTMTACSTLLAIGVTPLLIGSLGGQFLPVDRWGLFISVVEIVLLPVASGFVVRLWLRERVNHMLDAFPAVSVAVIVLIIACIVALSRKTLVDALGVVGFLVVAHNALGLGLGYALAFLFRLPPVVRRTVAIEVGMQNSGLGVTLAAMHFANPLVALPSSLFSVVHNLTGSALATVWRTRAARAEFRADQ